MMKLELQIGTGILGAWLVVHAIEHYEQTSDGKRLIQEYPQAANYFLGIRPRSAQVSTQAVIQKAPKPPQINARLDACDRPPSEPRDARCVVQVAVSRTIPKMPRGP